MLNGISGRRLFWEQCKDIHIQLRQAGVLSLSEVCVFFKKDSIRERVLAESKGEYNRSYGLTVRAFAAPRLYKTSKGNSFEDGLFLKPTAFPRVCLCVTSWLQVSSFLSDLPELSHKEGSPVPFLVMCSWLLGGGMCVRQVMSSGMREGASKETSGRLWSFPARKSIAYQHTATGI